MESCPRIHQIIVNLVIHVSLMTLMYYTIPEANSDFIVG